HAPRLAHARSIEAQRIEAAARELEPAEEDAHLLRVVHAVDDDHRGRGTFRILRRHEEGRQRRAFIRYFDKLDLRIAQPDALVPHLVRVRALRLLLRAGLDEALGVVVIDAGAQVVVAGRGLVPLRERLVAALL